MKKSIVSALLASSALSCAFAVPAFADVHDSSESIYRRITELENQNKMLVDELKELKKAIKDSAIVSFPESQENPITASVFAKALILKPSFDFGQTYAGSDIEDQGGPNKLYDLELGYSNGYEIGLDFQAGDSPWGAQVTFRELLASRSGSCKYDENKDNVCGSTIAHGNLEFGNAEDDGMVYKGLNNFSYNDLSALVTYDPVDKGAIDWKFFGGVRNVNVGRSISSEQFDQDVKNRTQKDTGSTVISSSYSGIGPALAVQGSKEIFAKNLNLYGKARVAFLNGTTSSNFLEIDDAFENTNGCRPAGTDICSNTTVSQSGWNPAYGVTIGLDYTWQISDAFSLNFDAAYEFDKFINAVADTQFPDDVNDFSSRTTFSDLTLSGASLGLKATYQF